MSSVRLFCPLDDSPVGLAALSYVDGIVAADIPLRLVGTGASASADRLEACGWSRHEKKLLTHVGGTYVNVVLGAAQDWRRFWTRPYQNSFENCYGNVLIATDIAPHADFVIPAWAMGPIKMPSIDAKEVVRKYDRVVVISDSIVSGWRALVGDHIQVIVVPPTEHAALRDALT